MSKKKSIQFQSYHYEKILDKILWFIENYLPQKKKKSSHAKLTLDKFESLAIHKIKNLASDRSKSLRGDLSSKTLTFTIGSWALPYLYLLKRIKILK